MDNEIERNGIVFALYYDTYIKLQKTALPAECFYIYTILSTQRMCYDGQFMEYSTLKNITMYNTKKLKIILQELKTTETINIRFNKKNGFTYFIY